jgi:hypothetical protein
MKYWQMSIVTILIVAIVAVAGFSIARAQDDDPPIPTEEGYPFGGGMGRGGHRFGGVGMHAWGEDGPQYIMHDSMMAGFAEALGLSVETLEARHEAGETMADIAESQGMSQEDFFSLMLEVRAEALELAVEDGLISQEQADWMLERMGGFNQFGDCTMRGEGQSRGPRGGGRWQLAE